MKILKFGAIWCPGCLVMSKIWSEIVSEYELEIEDYDIDLNEKESVQYNINDTLPVYVFLNKNNVELERLIGEQSKEKLINVIEKYKND